MGHETTQVTLSTLRHQQSRAGGVANKPTPPHPNTPPSPHESVQHLTYSGWIDAHRLPLGHPNGWQLRLSALVPSTHSHPEAGLSVPVRYPPPHTEAPLARASATSSKVALPWGRSKEQTRNMNQQGGATGDKQGHCFQDQAGTATSLITVRVPAWSTPSEPPTPDCRSTPPHHSMSTACSQTSSSCGPPQRHQYRTTGTRSSPNTVTAS
jgi:hypothetical protein